MENQSEQERIQQAMLAREVDEELYQEKIRNLWKKYQVLVYVGVAGILLAIAGYEFYQSWWHKVRLKESDGFEQAVINAHIGQTDEALKAFEEFSKADKTDYKTLSLLRTAQIAFTQNNPAQGLELLKQVMLSSSHPKILQEMARLLYVGNQIDTGNPVELQEILIPLMRPDNAFFGSASELSALLALKENDSDKAIAYLKTALSHPKLGENQKSKLQSIIDMLQGEK